MTEHFNGLTPAEDERLAMLAEECAEVIKIVSKIQRHGPPPRFVQIARAALQENADDL